MEKMKKKVCKMLSSAGHDMEDLKDYSDNKLVQMLMDHDSSNDMDHDDSKVMEAAMSRKKMCAMLSKSGHKMEDLKDYSDNKLMKMCNSMDKDEDDDKDVMEKIRPFRNFR